MGLFSNNKKECPICGNATPRILATKVEGVPICSDCAGKLDMRKDRLDRLTLHELEEYMTFYNDNMPLKKEFTPDYELPAGGFFGGASFRCDGTHHTFRTSILDHSIVYLPEHFVRLTITQDRTPVFELTKDSLIMNSTNVEEKIRALQDEVNSYNRLSRLDNALIDLDRTIERVGEHRTHTQNSMGDNRPDFSPEVPFQDWHVILELNHPWGEGLQDKYGQYFFDSKEPSVQKALERYDEKYQGFKQMVLAFRDAVCPNSTIIDNTNNTGMTNTVLQTTVQQQVGSVADEIKKFKDLLDMGAITEEEFAAKKAQLLNL